MRDLARYPITLDEAIEAVETALKEHTEWMASLPLHTAPVGNIHGLALENAARRLKRLQFAAQEVV